GNSYILIILFKMKVDKEFRENIQYPHIRNDLQHPLHSLYKKTADFEDIWDGKRMKEQLQTCFTEGIVNVHCHIWNTFLGYENISLQVGIDDISLFPKAKINMWPIVAIINNLPPALR